MGWKRDGVRVGYFGVNPNIKDKRIEKGLSQRELGKLAGLSAGHIKRIENRVTKPSGDALIRICGVLDLPYEPTWRAYRLDDPMTPLEEVKRRKYRKYQRKFRRRSLPKLPPSELATPTPVPPPTPPAHSKPLRRQALNVVRQLLGYFRRN